MSLATWKKEFYTPASRCKKEHALAHSLKKWEGLLPANLKKHGVVIYYDDLVNEDDKYGPAFNVSASTCALCHRFQREADIDQCYLCPLAKVTGNNWFGCKEQFLAWQDTHRPTKMINLIKKAIKAEEASNASNI